MRFQMAATAIVIVVVRVGAFAAEQGNRPESVVPVYVRAGNESLTVLLRAEGLANKMFRAANVEIEWRNGLGSHVARPDEVVVTLVRSGQAQFSSKALAWALPYEGTHIEVAYDRVKEAPLSVQPNLLAHVLVHEITHILQGISRHAPTGVMKAHWDGADYKAISMESLPFTAHDIALIQIGLKRASRAAVASPMASR